MTVGRPWGSARPRTSAQSRDRRAPRSLARRASVSADRARRPRRHRSRRRRRRVLRCDDASSAAGTLCRHVGRAVRDDRRPAGTALANSLRRRFARPAPHDAVFRGAHPHDRRLQNERLLAVHGTRLRQPDRSAAGAARRHHARAAARAGRLRRALSRDADSAAANVRAHARNAARRNLCRSPRSCRTGF